MTDASSRPRARADKRTPDNDDETRRKAITEMLSRDINRELIRRVREQRKAKCHD